MIDFDEDPELSEGAKKPIYATCPKCGKEDCRLDWNYCPICGSPLTVNGRYTTITTWDTLK